MKQGRLFSYLLIGVLFYVPTAFVTDTHVLTEGLIRQGFAKDFGVQGTVTSIQESVPVLKGPSSLPSPTFKPAPGLKLPTTTTPRTFTLDPTMTVQADLKDLNGHLLAKRFDKINPLNFKSLTHPILFFDGENAQHMAWALKQDPQAILVVMTPYRTMSVQDRPLYQDQGGLLVKHFGIKALPAKLSQEGQRLRIDEVRP